MKNIIAICLLSILVACSQKKDFSKESLSENLKDIQNQDINFQQILDKHKGKKVLIDVWASWCTDCIKAMPEMEKIKTESTDVIFVNLSCDKNYKSWQKGIERFKVTGDNYLILDGMDGTFGKAIDLSWIPRYILVNKDGSIFQYEATEPAKIRIKEFLNQ